MHRIAAVFLLHPESTLWTLLELLFFRKFFKPRIADLFAAQLATGDSEDDEAGDEGNVSQEMEGMIASAMLEMDAGEDTESAPARDPLATAPSPTQRGSTVAPLSGSVQDLLARNARRRSRGKSGEEDTIG